MILHSDVETMPREDLQALQLKRLRATVERCYHTVKFYHDAMEDLGVKPHHINTLNDVRLLPYTKKEHLRENYPFGLFAVPTEQVVRVHASSGTTGKPTVVGYTRRDVRTWAKLVARCLAASGMRPGDRLHNAYGYGLFTGGLGMHYGAEYLGMTVIPVSGGNTARQILLMQDFGPHVVACTPSYALTLADALEAEGVDRSSLNIKSFVLGAEPWTEGMRRHIEQAAGIKNVIGVY